MYKQAFYLSTRRAPPLLSSSWTEAELLDEIQTKVLKVFLLAIQSHLYSFALRFLSLKTHATPYSFYSALLYTICKEERRKNWYKTTPYSLGFKKSMQKPQVWELSRLCPETSKKLYVHEFGFWTGCQSESHARAFDFCFILCSSCTQTSLTTENTSKESVFLSILVMRRHMNAILYAWTYKIKKILLVAGFKRNTK